MIKLEDVRGLTHLELVDRALDLRAAAAGNQALERELPLPAKYYGRGFMSSRRRLGHVAQTEPQQFQPFIIQSIETIDHFHKPITHRRTLGMASAQVARPKPNPTAMLNGVELSYWHRSMGAEDARAFGKQILGLLIEGAHELPALAKGTELWMVTLPDDEIKNDVCDELGMLTMSEPQSYDISDGVTEPRQLWVVNA